MNEDLADMGRMLGSRDLCVRMKGLEALFGCLVSDLERFLVLRRLNYDEPADIIQETFFIIFTLILKGPLELRNPRAYIHKVAFNLAIDEYRRRRRQQEMVSGWPEDGSIAPGRPHGRRETEERLEYRLQKEELMRRCLHVEDSRDRQMALLRWPLGYSPQQICCLTGWPSEEVRPAIRRIKQEILNMGKAHADVGRADPSPWERQLPFSDDGGSLGINLLNITLSSFEPEAERGLLRDLGVTAQQLYQVFVPSLRLDCVNTLEPQARVCFVRRDNVTPDMLEAGQPVHYVDYTAHFERVQVEGGWREVLELDNKFEYSATMAGRIVDERGIHVGWDWYFTHLGGIVRKPVDPMLLHLMFWDRYSRKEIEVVYRFLSSKQS